MDNHLFFNVNCDFYTCHYELDPKFTNGLQVTIYAECSRNTEGVNGHYYALNLYFSADEIPVRDHIYGVTFGKAQMDKPHLDAEIDNWVNTIVSEDSFAAQLDAYMEKEKMWENAQYDE